MQTEYLERTKQELRLRNYSFKTVKAYLSYLREYFDFAKIDISFATLALWSAAATITKYMPVI